MQPTLTQQDLASLLSQENASVKPEFHASEPEANIGCWSLRHSVVSLACSIKSTSSQELSW